MNEKALRYKRLYKTYKNRYHTWDNFCAWYERSEHFNPDGHERLLAVKKKCFRNFKRNKKLYEDETERAKKD